MSETKQVKRDYNYEFFLRNKEKIYQKNKEKINCDLCNKKVNRGSYYSHKKSRNHILNMELYNLKNKDSHKI